MLQYLEVHLFTLCFFAVVFLLLIILSLGKVLRAITSLPYSSCYSQFYLIFIINVQFCFIITMLFCAAMLAQVLTCRRLLLLGGGGRSEHLACYCLHRTSASCVLVCVLDNQPAVLRCARSSVLLLFVARFQRQSRRGLELRPTATRVQC